MKSSMLHERRRIGQLIGLDGVSRGCSGREQYGVFDAVPTCGPSIVNPGVCALGKSYAYFSAANGYGFNANDYFSVAGFGYSAASQSLVTPAVGQECFIQSPNFSTPVGSMIYVRYIYAPVYSTASGFFVCLANWGRKRSGNVTLGAGQAYTTDNNFVYDGGNTFFGGGQIANGTEYVFTHKITIGSLVAGTTYNYTADLTAVRTSDGVSIIAGSRTATADLVAPSGANWNWEFYYSSANNDNLRITDLYMIGTGFPKSCGGL